MKKTKKILSYVLATTMMTSISVSAFAESGVAKEPVKVAETQNNQIVKANKAKIETENVSNLSELKTAIESKKPHITITAPITITESTSLVSELSDGVKTVLVPSEDFVGESMFTVESTANDLTVKNIAFDGISKHRSFDITSEDGSVSFENCDFENNSTSLEENDKANDQGGAIKISGVGTLNINASNFTGNKSRLEGGALSVSGDITTNISNTLFKNNESTVLSGGAVYLNQSASKSNSKSTKFNGVIFEENKANILGGAILIHSFYDYNAVIEGSKFIKNRALKGGAIANNSQLSEHVNVDNLKSNVKILNTEFKENTSKNDGGAIFTFLQADKKVDVNKEKHICNMVIEGSTFNGNRSETKAGGAIEVGMNTLSVGLNIKNSTFSNNSAANYGGAINLRPTSSLDISENTVFDSNTSGVNGGAINVLPEGSRLTDGEDSKYYENLKVSDTTFKGNKAEKGIYKFDDILTTIKSIHDRNVGKPKSLKSLSSPAVLNKDLAYNNYDISYLSNETIKENNGSSDNQESKLEVIYDANTKDFKGDVPVDNTKYSEDDEVKVLSNDKLSRDGYTFEGWNTKVDGSGTSYDSGETFKITEDITLYAQWKEEAKEDDKDITDILDKVSHNAYLVGYPDGTVSPDGNITRAETSAIYFRMMTEKAREENWKTDNKYTDVTKEAWYNNEVSTLSNLGAIKGYPTGDFKPDGDITRAEFASITARFLGDVEKASDGKLNDLKDHWAKDDINKLVAAGIIEGYEDGSFKPEQSITRAEAAKIVNGILERTPHKDGLLKDMKVWPDNNEKAWYYVDIQEATNTHEFERKTVKDSEKWTKILPNKDWEKYEKELEEKLENK